MGEAGGGWASPGRGQSTAEVRGLCLGVTVTRGQGARWQRLRDTETLTEQLGWPGHSWGTTARPVGKERTK